ncbi:MAG: hypothetical protein CMH44_02830 [Muricauda sp.]|nr:hypothetical protein [Allomuricauda sp.]
MNAVEIEEAISELAAQPFDRAEFPFAFLEAFGRKANTLKQLRAGTTNASDLPGGVLQRNNIHIATCDPGAVDETLKALRESPKTGAAKAKFILATDGTDLQAEDLVNGESVACTYSDFPNHFGAFLPLAGITTVKQIRENSFDIRATSKLNKLYVELLKENPDWATAERRPDMNHFMARLIFCFFAEDTDIFNGEGLFTSTVERFSDRESSNTHEIISNIFRAMDTPTRHEGKLDDRYRKAANIPPHADAFPYVNGALFSGSVEVPRFSRMARSYLLHIGGLNWKQINPDIFGSMIQAVADDEERGALGMHYTSVPNILKVLNPLFLDDLRQQLEEAGDNGRKLVNLRNRMAKIRVFDPACGSGNFLVIAYKQMREIEAEIQVPLIWPVIFDRGQRIGFCHTDFYWSNNASKNANVICIIVGVMTDRPGELRIYEGETKRIAQHINAYLIDGPDVIIAKSPQNISGLPQMFAGNIPRDRGNFMFSKDERDAVVTAHPASAQLFRRIFGSSEFINDLVRYCLWIEDDQVDLALSIPEIAQRLAEVRAYRETGSERGKLGIETPYRFERTIVGGKSQLIIPRVSSQRREFLPVGLQDRGAIISDAAQAIYDSPVYVLSLICSRMHICWVGLTAGRMKSDFRYSSGVCYNTFPVPKLTEQNKADLTLCAEDILLAREAHFPKTIAELYDPEKMPENLRHAHDRNDEVLERIYIGRRFKNDTERLEKLFELYTKMTSAKAA